MSWNDAENSEKVKFTSDENSFEREEREEHELLNDDDEEMSTTTLDNTLQKAARTSREEIVLTADNIVLNAYTDPEKTCQWK